MISRQPLPSAASGRRPRRAMEPADPLLRAALAGVHPRRGNPHAGRDRIRVAQRLAAGMSTAEVARAERADAGAIEGLLAQEGFRGLVDSYKALADQPAEEQTARLVKLARIAIENALADWDVGAACFVLREHSSGRDPARTVADRVLASARRRAVPAEATPPAPPTAAASRPPRPHDPLDALVHRRTAALRRAVVEEHAARHAAATPRDVPTTVEAARRALALRRDAGTAGPAAAPDPLHRLTRRLAGEPSRLLGLPALAAPLPASTLPRRPRAP